MSMAPQHDIPHPVEHATECLATAVRLLDRSITSIYDDALRPHAVRITQMSVLVVLARVGPLSATQLARTLRMDKSTVSRAMDRLIDNGWAAADETHDARSALLRVTKAGLKKIDAIAPDWDRAQKQATDLLGRSAARRILEAGFSLAQPPGS